MPKFAKSTRKLNPECPAENKYLSGDSSTYDHIPPYNGPSAEFQPTQQQARFVRPSLIYNTEQRFPSCLELYNTSDNSNILNSNLDFVQTQSNTFSSGRSYSNPPSIMAFNTYYVNEGPVVPNNSHHNYAGGCNEQWGFVNPQSINTETQYEFPYPSFQESHLNMQPNPRNEAVTEASHTESLNMSENIYPNDVSDPEDIYSPRWLMGKGMKKKGLCPICSEKGQDKWFKTKISAYWYHMNYIHGVSSITKRPFQEPEDIRYVMKNVMDAQEMPQDPLNKKLFKMEGKCHKCERWIPLDSTKNVKVKVPEIYWRKHAQKCHPK